jgi:hypothetical protein
MEFELEVFVPKANAGIADLLDDGEDRGIRVSV